MKRPHTTIDKQLQNQSTGELGPQTNNQKENINTKMMDVYAAYTEFNECEKIECDKILGKTQNLPKAVSIAN